jgi:CO/xanthine dehydrogenase FAD-binding subunit
VRSFLPEYELLAPKNLSDALERMAQEPGAWKPLAGGTDVMVLLEAGKLAQKKFINIWGLPEFRGIDAGPDAVSIGALTTYTEIRRHPILAREFPLLAQAAAETGGVATQNRGTIGGNIANASPAADSPPALLVYDSELELVSARGGRCVPYAGFHRGYKQMNLAPDEMIRCIRLPRGARSWEQAYRKVGTRRAQAISKVCLAAAAELSNGSIVDVRIALGSVAPVPLRATSTEAVLRGRLLNPALVRDACEALASEIAPIDDMRSTARYRRRVALDLLADFLSSIGS